MSRASVFVLCCISRSSAVYSLTFGLVVANENAPMVNLSRSMVSVTEVDDRLMETFSSVDVFPGVLLTDIDDRSCQPSQLYNATLVLMDFSEDGESLQLENSVRIMVLMTFPHILW